MPAHVEKFCNVIGKHVHVVHKPVLEVFRINLENKVVVDSPQKIKDRMLVPVVVIIMLKKCVNHHADPAGVDFGFLPVDHYIAFHEIVTKNSDFKYVLRIV